MREGWDFVSFSDYMADTRQITDDAANVIANIKAQTDAALKENEQLRRVIGALVVAAGGEVTASEADLFQNDFVLDQWANQADDTRTFRAKRACERSS